MFGRPVYILYPQENLQYLGEEKTRPYKDILLIKGSRESGEVIVHSTAMGQILDSWTCIIYLQRGFNLREVAGSSCNGPMAGIALFRRR